MNEGSTGWFGYRQSVCAVIEELYCTDDMFGNTTGSISYDGYVRSNTIWHTVS